MPKLRLLRLHVRVKVFKGRKLIFQLDDESDFRRNTKVANHKEGNGLEERISI